MTAQEYVAGVSIPASQRVYALIFPRDDTVCISYFIQGFVMLLRLAVVPNEGGSLSKHLSAGNKRFFNGMIGGSDHQNRVYMMAF
jgi:hypothetical protein